MEAADDKMTEGRGVAGGAPGVTGWTMMPLPSVQIKPRAAHRNKLHI